MFAPRLGSRAASAQESIEAYVVDRSAVTHTITYDPADRTDRIRSTSGGRIARPHVRLRSGRQRPHDYGPPARDEPDVHGGSAESARADGPWGALTWTYAAAGNRLTHGGTQAISYGYTAATQRLAFSERGPSSRASPTTRSGQLTADGRGTYGYSPLGS